MNVTFKSKRWKALLLALALALLAAGCAAKASGNSGGTSGSTVPEHSSAEPPEDSELERCVSEAVLSENKSKFRQGEAQMFTTECHEILKTVEEGDSVTVYLIALYAQYQGSQDEITLTGSVCSPAAIVFSKDGQQYNLEDYWVPEDGEAYASSIEERFPADIAEQALELELPDAMEACDQNARDYFAAL